MLTYENLSRKLVRRIAERDLEIDGKSSVDWLELWLARNDFTRGSVVAVKSYTIRRDSGDDRKVQRLI
jgi:hypothetical protein